MKKLSPAILAMFILVGANNVTAQPAATVKKQIIGTWVNGDNPDDIYIFSANGDCRKVFESGKKLQNPIKLTTRFRSKLTTDFSGKVVKDMCLFSAA